MFQALQNALAPDVPAIVDFRHQWGLFLRFYAEKKPLNHKFQPVERTNLVYHLNNMLKLLVQEQREATAADELGPCMEYLVHHGVLDVLSSVCQADVPPGIRSHVFNLFVFLMAKIRQNVLPYTNVYLPTRRLLMLSAVTRASPTEAQELNFVTGLVSKLKLNPELLSLFAHHSGPGDLSHSSHASSRSSSLIDLSHLPELPSLLEDFESSHLVVAALLNLVDSADYLVGMKAMDALLVVCGIDDTESAANAVRGTSLVDDVSDRLTKLFAAIPEEVEVAMVEEVRVNWVEAHHHLRAANSSGLPDFKGKAELVSFFSWLDFCDSLAKTSADVIAEAVCHSFRERFLENHLEVLLLREDSTPAETVRILALLTQCWVHLASEGLAGQFASWLFGKDSSSGNLKSFLLKLCLSENQEVTLEALSLFDVVLERPCDPILQSLVLGSLCKRGYYNHSLAESSAINSWSDEEDERERAKLEEEEKELKVPEMMTRYNSRTMAPTNIARVINAWLYLVPDELRSSDAAKDSGYEQYVKNAQTQVSASFRSCYGFRWPREAHNCVSADRDQGSSSSSSSDSRPEAEENSSFYEGDFLHTLFTLLETLLERDYDVNLQVTSILSKLAQLPHPCLHEYLLNPTIPLVEGAKTLHSVMRTLLEKVRVETAKLEQLQRKIYICRKTLLEGDRRALLNLTATEAKVIDGLIILEEFSKEIAAITLVKYHHAC